MGRAAQTHGDGGGRGRVQAAAAVPGKHGGGCGGARSVGEAAEHEVVEAMNWFAETVKRG